MSSGAGWRARSRRGLPVVALLVLMVILAVVTVAPREDGLPLDPRATGPDGTAALVTVLSELDIDVRIAETTDDVTGDGVVLVLRDPVDEGWSAAFEEALDSGARVVVTDPSSPLTPEVDQGLLVPASSPQCDLLALADVDAITGMGRVVYETPPGAVACFSADDESAWLVATERGAGVLIATGGAGFLTNSALDDADNAVLAVSLLATQADATVAVVGPGIALGIGEGDQTLTDIIPSRVKLALVQLLIALLVVVVWRWRRLGAPVEETLPVELPASALVAATGGLLDQIGAYQDAAQSLARGLRRDLALRSGLGPSASAVQIARAAAPIVGEESAMLAGVLESGPIVDADDLVAYARQVAQLRTSAGLGPDTVSDGAAERGGADAPKYTASNPDAPKVGAPR